MASTLCVRLLPKQGCLPFAQTVRHGSKAVTRHRKPVHFLRQKLAAVTEYVPPARVVPPGAYPSGAPGVQEENGLVQLRKRELKSLFQDCKMIAVVQNNASKSEEMINLKFRLHKHGIKIKSYPNQVTRSFLKDSIYCNMAPLFIGPTVLFVSKEPKVKELLMSLRFSPQMTLLGACVENTLLSVQGLVSYSKMPSMSVSRGQLVGGLALLSSHTASMLQHYPAHLSALLQQYIKQQSPDGGAEAAPKAEEAT